MLFEKKSVFENLSKHYGKPPECQFVDKSQSNGVNSLLSIIVQHLLVICNKKSQKKGTVKCIIFKNEILLEVSNLMLQ